MSQVRSGPDYAKRRQHVMTAPGHLFPGILARCACWSSWCLRQLSELQEHQLFLMNGLIITKTRMLKCGNWTTKLHTRYHFVACFGQQVSYGLAIDLIMLKMVSIWVTTKEMMQTCPSWFSLLVDCMVFAAWDSWQKYTMFRSNSFVQFDLNKWQDRMDSLQQTKSQQTCKTQEHLGLSSRHVSFMSWWNPPGQASWVKSIHHLGFQKLEPHSACHIQNQKCSNQKRGNLATWKHTYNTYIH